MNVNRRYQQYRRTQDAVTRRRRRQVESWAIPPCPHCSRQAGVCRFEAVDDSQPPCSDTLRCEECGEVREDVWLDRAG